MAHAPFDPSAYQVVVGPVALPLRPNLEEDAARLVEAYLVPRDAAEADPMGAVGSAIARSRGGSSATRPSRTPASTPSCLPTP